MMKKNFSFLILTASLFSFAQVGINTDAPTNTLDVNGDVRIRKIITINDNENYYDLVTDDEGVVKKVNNRDLILPGVPKMDIYTLPKSINNFLSSVGAGSKQTIPYSPIQENAKGINYDSSTNTFAIDAGLYTFTLIYEATHNATGCTVSSYFVDFPIDGTDETQRIHSTAAHNQGGTSNHGGSVIFSVKLNNSVTWKPALGRGQSGNCSGSGMTLMGNSTQLNIVSYDQ